MTQILSNERVIIAGKTRSGKTTLAKELTKSIRRLLILDSKGTLGGWNGEEWSEENRERLVKGENVRVRIVPEINQDPGTLWEEAFSFAFTIGNCTIYLDEAFAIFENANTATPTAKAIWTRGAEFGIGAWASTQRPSGIPLFLISEAEHYFCFRLTLAKDRERMSEFMGEEVVQPIRDKHGFWYYGVDDDRPAYWPDYWPDYYKGAKAYGNERSSVLGETPAIERGASPHSRVAV